MAVPDLLKRHSAHVKRNACIRNYIVTAGSIAACALAYWGMEHHAIAAGLATNLIWIWE